MHGAIAMLVIAFGAAAGGVGPQACAHRGDSGAFPENTLPAFKSAVAKGAAMIEFDCYRTKDGEIVIIHDATVDRTTDGSGRVTDFTLTELKALDAGSWFDARFAGVRIPTLRETLEVIPPEVLCNVHLKNAPGVAEGAARIIADMGRQDHCFLACTREQAQAARAIDTEIRICNMDRQGGDQDAYIDLTLEMKAEFIQLLGSDEGLAERVQRLHEHGVTVNYYGANEAAKIRRLAEAGADYILTDDLDTCVKVLQEFREAAAAATAP